MILPYAPFYIGVVASLLELFLVPRREVQARFHAAQGLSLHIAILVVQTLFGVVGAIMSDIAAFTIPHKSKIGGRAAVVQDRARPVAAGP